MQRARIAALIAVVLASAIEAEAAGPSKADREKAEQWYSLGEAAMTDGRHGEAALAFDAAYRLDPHPTLLYNAALAYERDGKPEAALERYQAFLIEQDAPEALRKKALDKVVALELQLRAAAEESEAEPPPPEPEPGPEPGPGVEPEPEPEPEPQPSEALASVRLTTTRAGTHPTTVFDASGTPHACAEPLTEAAPCELRVPPGAIRVAFEGDVELERRLEITAGGAHLGLRDDDVAAMASMWAGWGVAAVGGVLMGAAIGVAQDDPGLATDLGYAGQGAFFAGVATGAVAMVFWLLHDEVEVGSPTP